jgi:hypothetical protein
MGEPTGSLSQMTASPPYLRRRLVTLIAVSCAPGVVCLVATFEFKSKVPHWLYTTVCVVPGMVSGLAGVWYARGLKREHLRAFEAQGLLCWRCGYDLRGLGASGTCPECGVGYEGDDLKRRWLPPG